MSKEARESVKAVVSEGIPRHAIEVRRPKDAIKAIDMLAAGESTYAIKKATGLGHDAIQRLRYRHDAAIEERRLVAADEAERLMGRYWALAEQKAEDLEHDKKLRDKSSAKDIVLAGSILADKSMQLRGEATTVVEHRKGVSLEDAKAAIADAVERVKMKRVEDSIDA